jgi:hypothetical protein
MENCFNSPEVQLQSPLLQRQPAVPGPSGCGVRQLLSAGRLSVNQQFPFSSATVLNCDQ